MIWRSAGPTAASDGVKPGRVALVESESRTSTPSGSEAVDGSVVGTHAVDGGLVKLEVAGVHDVARRRVHEDAKRSWNGVRHGKERDVESTQGYGRAVLDLAKLGALDVVLGELALDDAKGELTGVDGHLVREVLQQVRKGARVVLVAVGDDNAAQLVLVLQDIGVVGQDEVDARLLVIGEHEAGIESMTMSFPYSNTVMFLPIPSRPPSGMILRAVSFFGIAGGILSSWSIRTAYAVI